MPKRKKSEPEVEPIGLTPAEAAERLGAEIATLKTLEHAQLPVILARLEALRQDLTGESAQESNGNSAEQQSAGSEAVAVPA